MQFEVIISGFGGQGALFAGQVLAYAALDSGKEVTWIPSYGPEMRGGTANCTVVIADEEIGSPLVRNPRAVIAMNLPSLEKYEPIVIQGGVLVANQSLIDRPITRKDIISVMIPAQEIAESIGNKKLINIVLLGAMLEKDGVLPLSAVEAAITNHIPERHRKTIPANIEALRRGAAFARGELVLEQA